MARQAQVWDDWYIVGHFDDSINLGCPECDWTYTHAFLGASVRGLRTVAEQHAAEKHGEGHPSG